MMITIACTTDNEEFKEDHLKGELCLVNINKLESAIDFIKSKLSKEDYQTLKEFYQFEILPID